MTVFELVKAFVNVTPEMEPQIREAMKFDPDMEVRIWDDYRADFLSANDVKLIGKPMSWQAVIENEDGSVTEMKTAPTIHVPFVGIE